jgi:hypothetical protein
MMETSSINYSRAESGTEGMFTRMLPEYPTSSLSVRNENAFAAALDSMGKLHVKRVSTAQVQQPVCLMTQVLSAHFILGNIELLGVQCFLEADSSLALTKLAFFYRTRSYIIAH